jgi:hypothetical protein
MVTVEDLTFCGSLMKRIDLGVLITDVMGG